MAGRRSNRRMQAAAKAISRNTLSRSNAGSPGWRRAIARKVSALAYDFRADLRAVYQYYCKNLPRSGEASYPLWKGIPADSKLTLKQLEGLVDECTGVSKPADMRTPLQKQNLANIIGVM